MGRDLRDLSKEELLEVIDYLGSEMRSLREDRDRWFKAGDVVKYLLQERPAHNAP